MKYIIICLVAIIICFVVGWHVARLQSSKTKKSHIRLKRAGLAGAFGIVLLLVISLNNLNVFYHADKDAVEAACSNPYVTFAEVDGGYFFDGLGENTAPVFYPDAKVETFSNTPLMSRLAEAGADCIIADMPFRVAVFGSSLADTFISDYTYDAWIMSGHSLGGSLAASYASSHADKVKGVDLLASYPTAALDNSLLLVSAYGSNDGCLDVPVYRESKVLWPANSQGSCIEGGNHAQFGNYGSQEGDGIASISAEGQQSRTVDLICSPYAG